MIAYGAWENTQAPKRLIGDKLMSQGGEIDFASLYFCILSLGLISPQEIGMGRKLAQNDFMWL